ncbi:hypothetical protein ASE28_17380 [Acidovorax sp. Root219]|nr:hypothetical protein ASE28_17380 [Acidovorax sp. Root219]
MHSELNLIKRGGSLSCIEMGVHNLGSEVPDGTNRKWKLSIKIEAFGNSQMEFFRNSKLIHFSLC